MNAKGLWTGRPLRTGVESLLPGIFLCLLPPVLNIGDYLNLGRLYILFLLYLLWIIFWPAYRLKLAPVPWQSRIRYWVLFLVCYGSAASVLGMIQSWALLQTPAIQRLMPFEHLNHLLTIQASDFWDILPVLPFILLARLLIHGWVRLARWISRRLIRQLTFSHILAILATLWLFACAYFFYLVYWEYPKWINGMYETEEVAEWASPIILSSMSSDSIQAWLAHMRQIQTAPMEPLIIEPIRHEWRIYDLQAEVFSQDNRDHSRFPEERALVQRVLNQKEAEVITTGPLLNTSLSAVPILDHQKETIIGVVLHEKSYSDPLAQASAFSVAFIWFLGFSGILFFVGPLLVALVGLVFAYWRAWIFRRRFQPFIDVVHYWSRGDLDKRMFPDQPDELGHLSQQLNQMADSLQHAMQSLYVEKQQVEFLLRSNRKLVADVSHELRTPLAILSSYLEESHKDPSPESSESHLSVLRREAGRLQQMIDELFRLTTQVEQQELSIQTTPVDAAELIQEVAETIRPIAWRERQITVLSSSDETLPLIHADRTRLLQILYNLLRNALRHTPEGGMVKVMVSRCENGLQIEVADTGSGIPAEDLPHIFSRYYQGKRKTPGSGRGLGLSIARDWLEKMEATIDVESHPGKGTRFFIRFPIPEKR